MNLKEILGLAQAMTADNWPDAELAVYSELNEELTRKAEKAATEEAKAIRERFSQIFFQKPSHLLTLGEEEKVVRAEVAAVLYSRHKGYSMNIAVKHVIQSFGY
jgi:hypothetical protein